MSELQEKLALAIADAEIAFEAGDLEKGEEKTQEAARWQKALQGLETLQGFKATAPVQDPIRPTLPGLPNEPTPKPDNRFAKALYTKRFGETNDFVKATLTDLHGADYEAQYWKHRQTFFKYIRGGDQVLTREERTLLRTPILTPAVIMDGLMQGVDSAKVFKATLVEGRDSLGGFMVPVDFQREIISRLPGETIVRPRARTVTTSRDAVEFLKLLGGGSQYRSAVRVSWVEETPTSPPEANPTFSFERIPIYTCMAETWLSKNLLEDAAFNLESYLRELFVEAIAMDEDNLFLTGDGVGKPQGILPNEANGLSLTEVDSGSAATIADWDKLKEVTYSIDAQYRQRAVWVAEKATYLVISQLKDGMSQYYWKQDQQQGQPRRLEGYEVLEQEGMPSLGTNLFPIIFGDLRGYTIADRVGMSVTRYDDSATARTNRVVVVLRRRLGGQVTETWRFVCLQCAA